jgi:REP element-mobilizing transposase RayT
MKYDPEIHHRRSIRLQDYDYSQPGAYFVTLVTRGRECLFGSIHHDEMQLNETGKIVRKAWFDLPNHYAYIELGTFCIMPNHMHGIIYVIGDNLNDTSVGAIRESPLLQQRRRMTISLIVGRIKMNSAKRINLMRETPGIPVWQRNYYDHVTRNDDDLNRIHFYIESNPAKWEDDDEYFKQP